MLRVNWLFRGRTNGDYTFYIDQAHWISPCLFLLLSYKTNLLSLISPNLTLRFFTPTIASRHTKLNKLFLMLLDSQGIVEQQSTLCIGLQHIIVRNIQNYMKYSWLQIKNEIISGDFYMNMQAQRKLLVCEKSNYLAHWLYDAMMLVVYLFISSPSCKSMLG